jgi:hypothetical protein
MSRNSSRKFDRPLRVELRASGQLVLASLGLYGTAALACWWGPVPAVLLPVLVLHFCYLYCSHAGTCLPTAICGISWDSVHGWRIRQARGDWLDAEPVLPVFVTHRLVAVRFRTGRHGYRSLLVVAQRCGADDFRRLRVRLIQYSHGNRDRAKVSGG